MAFAATRRQTPVFGNKRAEIWTFTELGTDTGGTFVTGLSAVEYVGVTVNGNFACSGTVSGTTVTVGNSAGPTGGYVLLIGY